MLSLPEPEQAAPPLEAAGLSQFRDRDWVPPPHVTLHEPQEAQEPQLPSTERYSVQRDIRVGNVHISKRRERLTISRPSTIQIGVHSYGMSFANDTRIDKHFRYKTNTERTAILFSV